MPTPKNSQSHRARLFYDFIPAELKQTQSDDWRVVFYCKIPGKEKLKRFRRRVPKLKCRTDRRKLAKQMCLRINADLQAGWSPFYEEMPKNNFQPFVKVLEQYLNQADRKFQDGIIRKDSFRAYTSYINNIKAYLKHENKMNMIAAEFDRTFVIDFLDHIYFERKRTARTANNYLSFLSQLAVFMVDRNLIPVNPAEKIGKRKETKKKRKPLPEWLRRDIIEYWKERNPAYLTLCMLTYFCFIRRTELTKLRVKFVNLSSATIFIPGDASKNGIDGTVTIPKALRSMLANHLKDAKADQYLFSADEFKPGYSALQPKNISDEWAKMRKRLKVDSKYQFYSLKDTGITNLLLLGVAAKKVRDQARHHDIRITEAYVARNESADNELKSIDFQF